MKQLIHSIIFILLAVSVHGQQVIPEGIAVSTDKAIALHVYASGVQVYRCTQDTKDTSRYVWTFQEPRANLFTSASYTKKVGKHYSNTDKSPTWELSDGSMISGAKLQQAPSLDSGSIPWLLLRAVTGSGKGTLLQVTFIQRLYTKGGVAPEKANRSQLGQILAVPYTAEYLFYK